MDHETIRAYFMVNFDTILNYNEIKHPITPKYIARNMSLAKTLFSDISSDVCLCCSLPHIFLATFKTNIKVQMTFF